MNSDDTLLAFPCSFSIKIMGQATTDFEQLVFTLVRRHVPELALTDLETRTSRQGRYLSITANIRATSRAQLDAIYRDLSAHEQVVMTL